LRIQKYLGIFLTLAILWGSASILRAQSSSAAAKTPAEGGKPEKFPDVDLMAGSMPRYAAITVDAWTKETAYILFDGNTDKGYNRLYFWVPGHIKYNRPVKKNDTGDKAFAPFDFFSTGDGQQAVIEWELKWGLRSYGPHKWFDYLRGVWVEVDAEVTKSPYFLYRCNYARARGTVRSRSTSAFPLSLGIDGEFTVSDSWEDLPPAIAPWERMHFYMARQQVVEGKKGRLHFMGKLQHWAVHRWWDVVIRAFPVDTAISLSINPYLDPPVYSNNITVAEAFETGVDVELPYGWYEYKWDFKCDGVNVIPRKDHHIVLTPQPFCADVHR